MSLNTLRDVFEDTVRDLYNAEAQIAKALPKMAKAASAPELKKAFEQHLEVTKKQIERLEKVCKDAGIRPGGKKCLAMEGLIREGDEVLKEKGSGSSKDAALIVAAQKIEHYEIAGYGSARTFADRLGLAQAAKALQRTLEEESKTDEKLTVIAERTVNRWAEEEAAAQEEKGTAKTKGAGGAMKGMAAAASTAMSALKKAAGSAGGTKKASASSSAGAKKTSASSSAASKKSASAGSSASSSKSAAGSKSGSSSASSSRSASAKSSGGSSSGSGATSKAKSGGKATASRSASAKSAGTKSRSAAGKGSSAKGKASAKSGGSSSSSNTTTDHDEIRRWAEERQGSPACVKGTGDPGDIGILRIDFPGGAGEESLQQISWDEFFEKFDEKELAFLYQDRTADGQVSRFFKLVSRSGNED